MAEDFGKTNWITRIRLLHEKGLTAEWDVPPGRLGQIVRQLRRRGRIASNRARVFLYLLIGVIALGLLYYLGQPLIQAWSDGTRSALAVVERQQTALESERALILDNPDPNAPGLRQVLGLGVLERIPTGTTEWLSTPTAIGETLFVAGEGGTLLRLDPGAAQATPIETGTTGWLSAPTAIGETLFVAGEGGTLLRLDPGAAQATPIGTGTTEWLGYPTAIGETLFVAGDGGTLLRLDPGAAQTTPIETGTTQRLLDPTAIGETLFVAGEGGTLFVTPPRSAAAIADLPAQVQIREDDTGAAVEQDPMRDFIDAIIPRLAVVPERLTSLRLELAGINAQRAALEEFAAERRARVDQGFFAAITREDPALAFAQFMEACGQVSMSPELADSTAHACLAAYAEGQASQSDTWWDILARQVPPGILLLFLLVTLGGLYRYNMRLSGFHHSRADLLELLAMGRATNAKLTKLDWQNLRESADALAADKVEFGATKAGVGPGGVNFEIARHLKSGE